MENGVVRVANGLYGILNILFQFPGGLRMHHGVKRIREAFESRALVAVRYVGILRKDCAGIIVRKI